MRTLFFILSSLLLAGSSALAEPTPKAAATSDGAVLAELFTSQSCSSCPSAERLFNKLSTQEGVVAIQWHVDYWNSLVHRRDGRWKDPYSTAANTQRQRGYNYALRGVGSVYTPQAVINGVSETTGSRARSIRRLVERAPAASADILVQASQGGYTIEVNPKTDIDSANAEAMLITLLKHEETEISSGENKGLITHARNIAVKADKLGAWTGTKQVYRAAAMADEYTCAIIVQEKNMGRVLAASYCPS